MRMETKCFATCSDNGLISFLMTRPFICKIFTRRTINTWKVNKVRELIAVKVLHTSLLNTTVVTFKVLPLESYALMSARSPPFKTIMELVL